MLSSTVTLARDRGGGLRPLKEQEKSWSPMRRLRIPDASLGSEMGGKLLTRLVILAMALLLAAYLSPLFL